MVCELLLRDGTVTLVDADVYEWAQHKRWYRNSNGYVVGIHPITGKRCGLHRIIMCPPPGLEVDHLNRNKLDNRRANMRRVTHQQNRQNLAAQRNSSTGVRGVSPDRKRYRARLHLNGKRVWVGVFDTIDAAGEAVQAARRRLMTHALE